MSTPSDRESYRRSGDSADSAVTKADGPSRAMPTREGQAEGRKSDRPSMRPGGAESLVGVVLSGRYLIERLIGEGGMGAVYQAEHTHMRKRLAVKVLHPEMSRLSEVVARFEREAMAAAHIEHPNVAAATDFGKLEDGSFFLVLEYVEGRSLRDAIVEGRLELGRALHIVRQVASALARAHSLGIVHRDLKPENVMLVSRDGDADYVKVLDFGIAKVPVGELFGDHGGGDGARRAGAPGQVLTQLGMVYGTPEYMAPEQALGQSVDPRADLYALGVMAFEMITGARPYENESKVTLLGMHVTAPIPKMSERAPDAGIAPEVEAMVTRLMAKEASARFRDAKELIDALDLAAGQLAARGRIADVPSAPLSAPGGARSSAVSTPERSGARAAVALGPTHVAQPAVVGASGGLASLVGASIGGAFRAAPPWVSRRMLAAGASVLVVAGLAGTALVLGGALHTGSGGAPVASAVHSAAVASSSLPSRPLPLPDPKVDDVVALAKGKIDKADFATAIDELTRIERKEPDRPDVHQLLERAYTGAQNAPSAMREADLWLAVDSKAADNPKLQEDVRNAALLPSAQDDAFVLLESRMGATGVDILYGVAYGAAGRLYPQAAARAKRSLELEDVRKRASPALGTLLEFRDAKTCEQRRALLDRAQAHGDARLLPILQQYQATRGCGFLGRSDCYPCLHRDHALADAMEAIEQRAEKAVR